MKTYSAIVALLVSVFLLIAGNALAGLIVPLRAKIEGFPEISIGLLGSAYFGGMLAGALVAPFIVRRAGHIRAFSAFIAATVAAVILYPLLLSPAAWLVLRGAHRLRLRRPLRGHGILDQRQGEQFQSRRALRRSIRSSPIGGSAFGQLLLTLRAPASYEAFSIAGAFCWLWPSCRWR